MAENLQSVLQAIDQLYGEVLDDAHWTEALRALQEALGCDCLCVAVRDETTRHTVQHTSRGVAAASGDRLVSACSVNAENIISPHSRNFDANRCSLCQSAPLFIAADVKGVVTAHWPSLDTGGTIENRQILQILLPHIARALLIDYRQANLRSQAADSAFLLERVSQAIMIIDAGGRLIRTNHKAEQILTQADGLVVDDGRLKAMRADETELLTKLITAAIQPGHSRQGSAISVSRPSGDRSYAVMIEPILAANANPLRGQGAAVIIVSDFERHQLLPWRTVADLFNLTHNEARLLVRLGFGDSLKEAASELKISYRTAALHLEHLLRKTRTHRQSELLRLLLLSPVVLAEPSKEQLKEDTDT